MNRHLLRQAIISKLYQHFITNKPLIECNLSLVGDKISQNELCQSKEISIDELKDKYKNDIEIINTLNWLSKEDKCVLSETFPSYYLPFCFSSKYQEDFFYTTILEDINNCLNEYIENIEKLLNKHRFNRLNNIDKAILVLASSELKMLVNKQGYLENEDSSRSIIINEALNFAKKFSASNNNDYKYINAVLEKIYE